MSTPVARYAPLNVNYFSIIMGDGDSEQPVPFGEIFTGQKSSPANDFESSLLDYSQPTYSANFRNYVDAVLQPQIQPYNSGSQLMRWDIGGPDDPACKGNRRPCYAHLVAHAGRI